MISETFHTLIIHNNFDKIIGKQVSRVNSTSSVKDTAHFEPLSQTSQPNHFARSMDTTKERLNTSKVGSACVCEYLLGGLCFVVS